MLRKFSKILIIVLHPFFTDETILPRVNGIVDVEDAIDSDMLELLDILKEPNHPGALCRLCGEPTVNPVYIFPEEEESGGIELSVADKINLCLPITVIFFGRNTRLFTESNEFDFLLLILGER